MNDEVEAEFDDLEVAGRRDAQRDEFVDGRLLTPISRSERAPRTVSIQR